MSNELGGFSEGFASWRKVIASVPTADARASVFREAATSAASYVGRGLDKGAAVDELQDIATAYGLVESFGDDEVTLIIRDAMVDVEYVPDIDDKPKTNGHAKPAYEKPQPKPLVFLNLPALEGVAVPERRWIIRDCIPCRNVTLLSGQGGVGKTLLAQQLAVATVLGRDWVGRMPEESGPVILLSAEDDEDEIHFRLSQIVTHYNNVQATGFRDLSDLHIQSLAGRDAVLATVSNSGIVKPTALFDSLRASARNIRPRWIGIDTAADVFVVDERDRSQVRQCISLLRGLALEIDAAILLLSHPSLEGIKSGSGISGSTAWNNSVRSRLYLRTPKTTEREGEDEDEADTKSTVRILEVMKANYGPTGNTITLDWRDGILKPTSASMAAPVNAYNRASADTKAREVFMALLQRANDDNVNVSPNMTSKNNAPKVFGGTVEGKAIHPNTLIRRRMLAAAMDYLLRTQKIETGFGPRGASKSKQTQCLYVARQLL